jgi:hypothetical protein
MFLLVGVLVFTTVFCGGVIGSPQEGVGEFICYIVTRPSSPCTCKLFTVTLNNYILLCGGVQFTLMTKPTFFFIKLRQV